MRTACVYHSIDLDGWMSAAIVKYWFINGNDNIQGTGDTDLIDFIGYNYGQPIPDLLEYDKVIMCDISFSKEEMTKLATYKDFTWLDHHISAIKENDHLIEAGSLIHPKGKLDTTYAACELTWKYFFPNEEMPEIVRLLGRYDCFGHKGTDEELYVLEFQYGARQCISNYEDAYNYLYNCLAQHAPVIENSIWLNGKSIYQYLRTEAKQTYKNGFEVILENRSIDFSSRTDIKLHPKYKFICFNANRFNPINFGIDYHKDGYDGIMTIHFANRKWNVSLYNDNGLVDCSVIAKQFGGGGHKGAAGFTLYSNEEILGIFPMAEEPGKELKNLL